MLVTLKFPDNNINITLNTERVDAIEEDGEITKVYINDYIIKCPINKDVFVAELERKMGVGFPGASTIMKG